MEKQTKKTTIGILMSIMFLTLSSAMYAGETYNHNFNYPIINCSIIDNTYDLEGLNLSWNGSIATISTVINYKPDSFSLLCWINETIYTEPVVVSSGGSGGGHSKKKVVLNNITNSTNQTNVTIPIIEIPVVEEIKPVIEVKPTLPIVGQNNITTPIDNSAKNKKTFIWAFIIAFVMGILILVVIILLVRKKNTVITEDKINETDKKPDEEVK
jgi:heme/copper-type cytochrome/quinol oxidase subunit 4